MAKPTPPEGGPKKKSLGAILVWALLAMVVAGLGGFGVTNFGGGVSKVGTVGTRDLTTSDYARALRQELDSYSQQVGQPVALPDGLALGLDRRALQGMVTRAALDNEAARIGISVGDEVVAQEILKMKAFQSTAGSFDRETYRFALQRNNITERQFETGLREDVSRSILQGAVVGGFTAPATLTDTLYSYIAERRGFSMLRLSAADLAAPLPAPTDADLQAYYTANIAKFTHPEARRITYVALLPETLAPTLTVEEATLRKMYQDRIADYVQPERRLVERLVYPTDADAEAAKAKLDAGTSFEDLVKDRGLTMDDVDLGDVAAADLGAAGEAVFALTEPGVVGPFASDLGPALFRMNAILAAQETTFEQARADLATEAAQDAARRAIGDRVESIDDQLASGITLEDLAAAEKMQIATIDYVPNGQNDDPITGYADFRTAADKVAKGDFPEAILFKEGGLAAMRLDDIVPPAPIPFEEARDKVVEAFQADALAKALSARAIEVKAAVEGGASLGSFGIIDTTPEIARDGFVDAAPPTLLPAVFKMAPGDMQVIEGPDFVALVRLDTVKPAAAEGDSAKALKDAISAQVEQAIAQDAFAAFNAALTAEAGVQLDQAAINAVHAQFR